MEAFDIRLRAGVVQKIAVRLGQIKRDSPASQLQVARQFEEHVYNAAKSVEDYHRKIDKRLSKAAQVAKAGEEQQLSQSQVQQPPQVQQAQVEPQVQQAQVEPQVQQMPVRVQAQVQAQVEPRVQKAPFVQEALEQKPVVVPAPICRPESTKNEEEEVSKKRKRSETESEEKVRLINEHGDILEWFAARKYIDSLSVLRSLLSALPQYSEKKKKSIQAIIDQAITTLEKNANAATVLLQILKEGKLTEEKRHKFPKWIDELRKRRENFIKQLDEYMKVYAPKTLTAVNLTALESDLNSENIIQALIDSLGTCLSRIEEDHSGIIFVAHNDGFAARILLTLTDNNVVAAIGLALSRYDEPLGEKIQNSSQYYFWKQLNESISIDAKALAAEALKDQRASPTTAPAYIVARLLVIIAHRVAQACTEITQRHQSQFKELASSIPTSTYTTQ